MPMLLGWLFGWLADRWERRRAAHWDAHWASIDELFDDEPLDDLDEITARRIEQSIARHPAGKAKR